MVHLGNDIYISSTAFDSVIWCSDTPRAFTRNMVVTVFGYKVLKKSSVTGQVSNRIKSKSNESSRLKLDSVKLVAIKAPQYKQTGSKRGRLLMRQPRVKKESEPGHPSPESEPGSPHIVPSTSTLNLPQSSQNWEDTQRAASPHTTAVNQPTSTTVTGPTNLLTVPQPSYLVKQHSHPLLPSQQQSVSGSYLIHRQHSNPEYPGRTTSPSIVVDPAPTIKTEEGTRSDGKNTRESGSNSSTSLRVRTTELRRSSSSPQTGSRIEARGSRDGLRDQRLGHCPVQRPGPALGCNHCWNTIDAHGRILRRKTKYHCPECQINLCIVPCFQEFHERQRDVPILRPLPKTSSI